MAHDILISVASNLIDKTALEEFPEIQGVPIVDAMTLILNTSPPISSSLLESIHVEHLVAEDNSYQLFQPPTQLDFDFAQHLSLVQTISSSPLLYKTPKKRGQKPKILKTQEEIATEKSRPKAYGVVFRDRDGAEHRVLLKKGNSEVIISAGALGSPQLLMLSGIGPAEELKNMGIRVIMDQPEVGKNMADNPMNPIFVPSAVPLELSLIQVVGITKFGSFIEAFSGYGLSSENIMTKGGIILEKVSGPHSRGYLRLNSTNAGDNPVVKFNYFEHPVDLQRCVKGIRTIEKIIISRPMKQFIPPNVNLTQIMSSTFQHPINLIPRKTGDWDSLKQFCKDKVTTIWHYHGGCQVGSVVDGEYKLIGADGVRVIDGSTFLFSPGTNPQATVLMLGRYMGVRILRERLGRSTEV
ncbi:protein HOTHEAD-like [Cryptomeria japonica]|uniref:protein HOTHEAD-like n=1 Tax=Cryptomeria japonica TaxID=3369 RepID=UPI0027D9EB1F|nr:protein HOTHEAD-like [Cryptomeria japonica]